MRTILTTSLAFLLCLAQGQVTVDSPIRMTGGPADRKVEGLALPQELSAATTVEASLLGTVHWASATAANRLITLTPTVASAQPRTGDLLRFLSPAELYDSLRIRFVGQTPHPLYCPDGVPPARGQMATGTVCEVLFAGDRWVLLNAPVRGCPAGMVQINDHLCVEATSTDITLFSIANDRCAGMGGRLCSWGEFYIACTQHAAQLTGIGTAWEWLDDTSNHLHSMCQAGATGCTSQRWANPETSNTFRGRGRCCFEPR